MFRLFASVCLLLSVSIVGCNRGPVEPTPITHKVTGRITHQDGKEYSGRGVIQFVHATKDGVRAISEVKTDGSFELHTLTAQHKVLGAEEGTYNVTIIPHSDDQTKSVPSISVAEPYIVSAGENTITVKIGN